MQQVSLRRALAAAIVSLVAATPAHATGNIWDSTIAGLGTVRAEWAIFDGYPTDSTPDVAGAGSITETTGAAFLTGGGNIYSFAAATEFSLVTSGLNALSTVWLRTGTLGTLPIVTATLNGVAATAVETYSEGLGGFGGSEKEWYWKWTGVGPTATYSFNFKAAESSMSLDQVAVYAAAAPVPEPGEWAMLLSGLALLGGIARRRTRAMAA